jgi:hypothetical protein
MKSIVIKNLPIKVNSERTKTNQTENYNHWDLQSCI